MPELAVKYRARKSKRRLYQFNNNADLLGFPPLPPEPIKLQEALLRYPPSYPGRIVTSGQFTGTYSPSTSTVGPIPLRVYYIPIQIPYTVLIDMLSVYVTIASPGTQIRLGIFAIERGIITKHITSNITHGSDTGVRSTAIRALVTAGTYALAYITDILVTVRTFAAKKGLIGAVDPSSAIDGTHYIEDKDTFAEGFSDDPTVSVDSFTIGPHIFARIG